jgi:hypothetical protein
MKTIAAALIISLAFLSPAAAFDAMHRSVGESAPVVAGGAFLTPVQYRPLSNVCVTPYGACYLRQYGPRGAPCWCATPRGPISGRLG